MSRKNSAWRRDMNKVPYEESRKHKTLDKFKEEEIPNIKKGKKILFG